MNKDETKRVVPKWLRILIRIILLPVAFTIHLIPHIIGLVVTMYRWVKYGGEFIVYNEEDVISMAKIFNEIKNKS